MYFLSVCLGMLNSLYNKFCQVKPTTYGSFPVKNHGPDYRASTFPLCRKEKASQSIGLQIIYAEKPLGPQEN